MTSEGIADLMQARRTGARRWQAKCPAHPDRNPSLSITEGRDGRTLVHCWAGCALDAVLAALGLSMRDLFAGPTPSPSEARQLAIQRARRDAEASAEHRKGWS